MGLKMQRNKLQEILYNYIKVYGNQQQKSSTMHTILQNYHGKIVESGICGKRLLSIWTICFVFFVCGRKTGFPILTGGLFSAYLYPFTVQKKRGL